MLTTFAISAAAVSSTCSIAGTAAYCFACVSLGSTILHIKKLVKVV